MVTILTGEFYEETQEYDVLCQGCRQVVSRETKAVCSALTCRTEEIFCFDCDPLEADQVPPALIAEPDEILVIFDPVNDKEAEWKITANHQGLWYALAGVSARCLSSSPQLSQSERNFGKLGTFDD